MRTKRFVGMIAKIHTTHTYAHTQKNDYEKNINGKRHINYILLYLVIIAQNYAF